MICVYPSDCTDFSNNGLDPVQPQSCTVTETLNGEWELTLVHPIDEKGRWTRLTEGRILRAPVPAAMTPQVRIVSQSADIQIVLLPQKTQTLVESLHSQCDFSRCRMLSHHFPAYFAGRRCAVRSAPILPKCVNHSLQFDARKNAFCQAAGAARQVV